MIVRRLIFFWSLVLWAVVALATAPPTSATAGWYQASVPVSDQTTSARTRALRQALRQVLIRVSGQPAIGTDKAIKPLLRRAAASVQQYSYQQNGKQLQLHVAFQPSMINHALQQAGITVLSTQRPPVLLWLLVPNAAGKPQIANGDEPAVREFSEQLTTRYGLHVEFPLLDLTDLNRLNPQDIQTFNLTKVLAASQRYQAKAVLLGHVYRSGTQWYADWEFALADKTTIWHSRGADMKQLMQPIAAQILTALTAQMQAQAATVTDKSDQQDATDGVLVRLTGISSLSAYAHALAYLKQLPVIKTLQLKGAHGSQLTLLLTLQGTMQNFMTAVNAAPTLSLTADASGAEISLHWLGR